MEAVMDSKEIIAVLFKGVLPGKHRPPGRVDGFTC
jgi:hypothetical protein